MVGDFSHLPVRHPFIAFMPQWDFLNFLSERAETVSRRFTCGWKARSWANLEDEGRVVGLRAKTGGGARGPRR